MNKTTWNEAKQSVPNYSALHDFVCARAGEGEKTTAELLGFQKRNFCFDDLYILNTPSGRKVVYSMDAPTGQIDVELIS